MTATASSIATLPRSTPEAQGVSSSAIMDFTRSVNEQVRHFHSFMLLRHGHVVAEGWWDPYRPSQPHMLFSLTKSFTSTAVGMAISEGKFTLDDLVMDFFPAERPVNPSENLKKLKVCHLITMGTGHSTDPTGATRSGGDNNWVRAFLASPPDREPGSLFVYNSAASHMLSAIVQAVTGQTLREYLMPRLFEPLGIGEPEWETCPMGRNTGGWGLRLTTESVAKFGQLYLNRGSWQGRQLVPADWVRQATSRQIDNGSNPDSDWNQGYCFQFWRCRHEAYRGDGAFGQYCVVMPHQDAVLAITSGIGDMQLPLNLAWKHLLPAMGAAALPADGRANGQLRQQFDSLSLPTVAGSLSSPVSAKVDGKSFRFPANDQGMESLSFRFAGGRCEVSARIKGHAIIMNADFGKWASQIADGQPIASSYAWTGDDTCTILTWQTTTPFSRTMTCRFAGRELTLAIDQNVSFGPTHFGPFVGTEAP